MMNYPNSHVPFKVVDQLYDEHAPHAPRMGYGDDPNERIEMVELHESEGEVHRFTNLLGLHGFRLDRIW